MQRKIVQTEEQWSKFIKDFNWKVFSFDTETTSLRYDSLEIVGVSLSDGNIAAYIPLGHKTGEEQLMINYVLDYLSSKFRNASLLIAHNMPYDCKVLYKYGINCSRPEWFDTQVAAHLIDENRSKKLKDLAKTVLGVDNPNYFNEVTNGKNAAYTSIKSLGEYAIDDAVYTWQLAQVFKEQLKEQGLINLFRNIEMPFLRPLVEMEINGVKVDLEKASKIKDDLERAVIDITTKLYESLGEEYKVTTQTALEGKPIINVVGKYSFTSPIDLKEIIFDKLKLPVVEKTPIGEPSTGSKTLAALKGKHEFIDHLIQYRIVGKLLSSFFNPMKDFVDSDGRVRSSFNDTGTVTGRLSSSNPNLQQLPNVNSAFPVNTRECFVASKGKKMIAIDYSQQELRIMAHLSKDQALIDLLNNQGDQHLINARAAFNLDFPLEYCYKTHPKYEETKSKYKAERNQGKVFSFSIPYGAGAHKIASEFGVSVEEAEKMLNNYYEGFPGLKKAMEETQRLAEKQGFVTTYTGRRRRFPLNQWGKLDGKSLRQSFNFLIQSFGADLIRIAMVKLYNYGKRNKHLGIKTLMTVHDEVVIECNEDYAEEVLKKGCELFESCGKLVVPLVAEGDVGNNYGDAK